MSSLEENVALAGGDSNVHVHDILSPVEGSSGGEPVAPVQNTPPEFAVPSNRSTLSENADHNRQVLDQLKRIVVNYDYSTSSRREIMDMVAIYTSADTADTRRVANNILRGYIAYKNGVGKRDDDDDEADGCQPSGAHIARIIDEFDKIMAYPSDGEECESNDEYESDDEPIPSSSSYCKHHNNQSADCVHDGDYHNINSTNDVGRVDGSHHHHVSPVKLAIDEMEYYMGDGIHCARWTADMLNVALVAYAGTHGKYAQELSLNVLNKYLDYKRPVKHRKSDDTVNGQPSAKYIDCAMDRIDGRNVVDHVDTMMALLGLNDDTTTDTNTVKKSKSAKTAAASKKRMDKRKKGKR